MQQQQPPVDPLTAASSPKPSATNATTASANAGKQKKKGKKSKSGAAYRKRGFRVYYKTSIVVSLDFNLREIVGFAELYLSNISQSFLQQHGISFHCRGGCIVNGVEFGSVHTGFTQRAVIDDTIVSDTMQNRDYTTFVAHYRAAQDTVEQGGDLTVQWQDSGFNSLSPSVVLRIHFRVSESSNAVKWIVDPHRPVQAYTVGGLQNASSWFPCLDTNGERTNWKISITVPADMAVIAPGKLAEVSQNPV